MPDPPNTIAAGSNSFSSELYLHNSEHPNYVLSTTLLNDRNYSHWRRSVEVSLGAKNKLGFVDGSCKRPEDTADGKKWDRCNAMVISWLLHSVEKGIAESILYCHTASQIWSELKGRFGKSNRTRIYQIQRDLNMISQGTMSVSSYFTKLKKLWDEYMLLISSSVCSCGSSMVIGKVLLDQQIVQFLMGLNESFTAIRGNVLMMDPAPNLDAVYQIILQEEQQRSIGNASPNDFESMALAAQRGQSRGKLYCEHCKTGGHSIDRCYKLHGFPSGSSTPTSSYCEHCKIKGHSAEKCWKIHGFPQGKYENKYFCEHCKLSGHTVDRCWKLHGYPPGKGSKLAFSTPDSPSPSHALTAQQYDQLISLLNKHSGQDSISHAAFLAGPFDVQASCDWP